jgi:fumarate reductase subunit C
MVLYHSITWFDTGARVKALWRGEERVNPSLLAAAQYAGWIVVSVVVALVALSVAKG